MAAFANRVVPVKLQVLFFVLVAAALIVPSGYAQGPVRVLLRNRLRCFGSRNNRAPIYNPHSRNHRRRPSHHRGWRGLLHLCRAFPAGTYDVKVDFAGFHELRAEGYCPAHQRSDRSAQRRSEGCGNRRGDRGQSGGPGRSGQLRRGPPTRSVATRWTSLAIVGRNAVELLKIIPGAQNSGGWNGQYNGEVAAFNSGAGAYTVNGTRFRSDGRRQRRRQRDRPRLQWRRHGDAERRRWSRK